MREPPGHGNSHHNAGKIPEKLGGEDPGWGAYQELHMDSTTPCKSGPHIHLDDLEPLGQEEEVKDFQREEDMGEGEQGSIPHTVSLLVGIVDDEGGRDKGEDQELGLHEMEKMQEEEEMIKIEIMLGMTKEEGIPCLLCLRPMCSFHVSLEMIKLDNKLVKLRNMEQEQDEKEELLWTQSATMKRKGTWADAWREED